MTTYRVRFEIAGYIDIEADSREDAEDMKRAISKAQWAAEGDLVTDEPMTLAEYDAAIRETREGPAPTERAGSGPALAGASAGADAGSA